jgi:hypothetical protein
LSKLYLPLQNVLPHGSNGLDYGSGPQPTLSLLFEEAGHSVRLYDCYYAADAAALETHYDFITASEVVEHLREPQRELDRLWACVKPGGWLGIMTQFLVEPEAFPAWHYKNDLTHVCFFPRSTFSWLAGRWAAELTFADAGVVLFRKRPARSLPEGPGAAP